MVTYGVRLERSSALRLKPHPDGPSVRTLHEWCAAETSVGRPLALDLFSGAGGLSLGLHEAGWSVAAAVDHDPWALETHRANVPGLALDLDLGDPSDRATLLRLFEGVSVDLVAGGPPCQPFSRAGRSKIRSLVESGQRDETDSRRELWRSFVELALALKPRAVLMENVPDMAFGDDMLVVRTIVDMLEGAGYATDTRIVDAWKHGVPQHRKRLILLARNDGLAFEWPERDADRTTVAAAIFDLPRLGRTTGSREMPYGIDAALTTFQRSMRSGSVGPVVYDHMTRAVRDDDLEIFQLMDSSTLYSEIPAELRRYTADSFDDKYKRLGWDDLSRTITAHIAKDGYWYIHPEEHRTLTVREAARLQTFPDDFRFSGTRSAAFRQIGNAVPPMLGAVAAGALRQRPIDLDAAPPANWSAAREALTEYARGLRRSEFWHMVPGPWVTPPVALSVAVLASGRLREERVGEALMHLRGKAKLDMDGLRSAAEAVGPRGDLLMSRLRPLVPKRKLWPDQDDLKAAAHLSQNESELYDVLLGGDGMLRSAGVARVAARVAGTESDRVNRNSDGRVDLARLVGSGEDAALRMSALRALAVTTCRVQVREHDCRTCPLSAWCARAGAPVAREAVAPVPD